MLLLFLQVMSKVRGYVDDMNANPEALVKQDLRGPCSHYELPDEHLKGRLELKFFDNVGKGVRHTQHTQTA